MRSLSGIIDLIVRPLTKGSIKITTIPGYINIRVLVLKRNLGVEA